MDTQLRRLERRAANDTEAAREQKWVAERFRAYAAAQPISAEEIERYPMRFLAAVTESRNGDRLNETHRPHYRCAYRHYGTCQLLYGNPIAWCRGCRGNTAHMLKVVRLVLTRKPELTQPKFVSFNEHEHGAESDTEWWNEGHYEGRVVRIWSTKRQTHVYRDTAADWWNANNTLEYNEQQQSKRREW